MDEQSIEMFMELVDDKLDEMLNHKTIYYTKENGEKYHLDYNELGIVIAWYENCFKADMKKIFTQERGIILNI